jgi:hypothetical protein
VDAGGMRAIDPVAVVHSASINSLHWTVDRSPEAAGRPRFTSRRSATKRRMLGAPDSVP